MDEVTRLKEAASACIENGKRLLEDGVWLESREPPASQLFLTMIAQEEFAKAFLLGLVVRGVIPWSPRLLRLANSHVCKQLLGVILDFVNPETDEWIARIKAPVVLDHEWHLPHAVSDSINILCLEKMQGLTSDDWKRPDQEVNREAKKIAQGRADRQKQDLLYVRLSADGGVAKTPEQKDDHNIDGERYRAERWASAAKSVLEVEHWGLESHRIEPLLMAMFSFLAEDRAN